MVVEGDVFRTFGLSIQGNAWSKAPTGTIKDVSFTDITVTGKQTGDVSKIFGHSPTANIDGVSFSQFKAITIDDTTDTPVEIGPQQDGESWSYFWVNRSSVSDVKFDGQPLPVPYKVGQYNSAVGESAVVGASAVGASVVTRSGTLREPE